MAHVEGRDPGSQLADAVHHWVEAGIVTPAQADAIFEFERAQAVEPLQPAERREGRLPLATELLSYLGIALVIMSGTFLVTRFWSDLHIGGRVAVGLVAAVVGLLGSTVVTRIGGRGACRLGSFLALCGTGGVALTVGLAAVALGSHSSTVVLAVGLAVLALSLVLWRNDDRPLPFLSSIAGVVATAVGLYGVLHLHLTPVESGVVVWCTALALGVLGTSRLLRPPLLVLIVAELGTFVGALVITPYAFGWVLGLLTATAALGVGLWRREPSVVVIAVACFLFFLARTLSFYFQGPVAAIGVLVVGLVLVIVAFRLIMHPHKRLASSQAQRE